jgi:hypothetical protein
MAVYNNPFDSYQLIYYGGFSLTPPPPPPPPPPIIVIVQCYQANVFTGQITFYRDDQVQPNTTVMPFGTAVPAISLPISCFDSVFEMLRHTHSLYLFLDTSTGAGFVATSATIPVGEEEVK